MIVNRYALLVAGVLCFGFSGPDTPKQAKPKGSADWTKANVDPVVIAERAEKVFKTFKSVAGGVRLDYKIPYAADPSGYGVGYLLMNEYFWSPTKFRIEYMDSGRVPSSEFVAVNGNKKARLGQQVNPKLANFSIKHGIFDVASDAALVEQWPTKFGKYIFTSFPGGNATLSRYVKALKKGVGGYSVRTDIRYLTTRKTPQYRIYATRPAKGKLPASTVEMIFAGELPFLPVTIATTYGTFYRLNWNIQWYNKADLRTMDPFKIAPLIKK